MQDGTKRTSRKAHTPVIEMPATTPSRPERPPSPLSPTRQSREIERRSMQNLNDRLAVYIDAVRSREAEIQSLKQERSIIEDTHSTELIQTKTMYNKELGTSSLLIIKQLNTMVELESREFMPNAIVKEHTMPAPQFLKEWSLWKECTQ